ncbi:hypothetical protein BJ742DRAFT_677372 [Cladochytrium replicatum]|nr:hypothetical protein BJ742DRAFT_677372 [Cladochytrium replicatum]
MQVLENKTDSDGNDDATQNSAHAEEAHADDLKCAKNGNEEAISETTTASISFESYRSEADNGHVGSQVKLGECYQYGIGIEKSFVDALKWYRVAVENDYPHAHIRLGEMYLWGNGVELDRKTAFRHFQIAAEQGYALGQYLLGYCYQDGYGVKRDYEKSFQMYLLAAEQDLATAKADLGRCYEEGTGVERNIEMAELWYSRAFEDLLVMARDGDVYAQDWLGWYYRDGLGGQTVCPEKSVEWFRKAADEWDSALAQCSMAIFYQTGYGQIEENPTLAFEYFLRSAQRGIAMSQNSLGYCYWAGQGCEKDYKLAAYWFEQAAESDIPTAKSNIACCYQNGYGVSEDPVMAFAWYKKGAMQCHNESMYNLGYCFARGIGTDVDRRMALQWYRKASYYEDDERSDLKTDQLLCEVDMDLNGVWSTL